MSNEISNERLELAVKNGIAHEETVMAMAKELLALRKAHEVWNLVPDAERINNDFDDWRDGWNACRAAILCSIEQQSK